MKRRRTYSLIDKTVLLLLHFDGDVKDSSLNGYTGDFGGSITFPDGKFDRGLNAGGTGYLQFKTIPSLNINELTIEWWEYNTSLPTSNAMRVIDLSTAATNSNWTLLAGMHNGNVYQFYLSGDSSERQLGMPDLKEWTHYAIVKNGANWKTFRKGALTQNFNKSVTIKNDIVSILSSASKGLAGNPYKTIDEFRISSKARYSSDFIPQNKPFKK